jgi:hypothetical protein
MVDTKPHLEKHRFKPGQSGNRSGKPKTDPKVKAFKEMTYDKFIEAMQKYGNMTAKELKDDLADPQQNMFNLIFGGIVQGAAKGDHQSRELLIERLWGKVKEAEHDVNINIRQLPTIDLLKLGKEAMQYLEGDVVDVKADE